MGSTPSKTDQSSKVQSSEYSEDTLANILSNGIFINSGGIAAILGAVVIIAIIAFQISLSGPTGSSQTAKLTYMSQHESMARLVNGLYPILHVMLIVLFLALYQLFTDRGGIAKLGLVGGLYGVVFFLLTIFVFDARITLATQYVAASSSVRQAIFPTVAVLERLQNVLSIAAHVFTWGIGVGIFSVGIIRTSLLSKWIGWIGVVFAIIGWLNAPRLVSSAFDPLLIVLNLIAIIWLFAIGIGILRTDFALDRTSA
ncbi:MAG: hypothetical protein ABEI06_08820 [Halobacteriaceae archaeon]